MSNDDAGNYKVVVRNKHGEKANHVRLSMKDENAPKTDGIEPTFFRKPTSRQVNIILSYNGFSLYNESYIHFVMEIISLCNENHFSL